MRLTIFHLNLPGCQKIAESQQTDDWIYACHSLCLLYVPGNLSSAFSVNRVRGEGGLDIE